MSEIEKEIINAFEFLIKNHAYNIYKRDDEKYEIDFNCTKIKTEKRAHQSTIDFKNKTIELYSYNESYHNGDHYDCDTAKYTWENIDLKFLHTCLKDLVYKIAEKKAIQDIATAKVKNILSGK